VSEPLDDGDIESDEDLLKDVATSTERGKNRFRIPLFIRVTGNKTLRPCKKEFADFTCTLVCEYPTYSDELAAKKNATTFDEYHSVHYVESEKISEWRIANCIVRWNLQVKIPGLTRKLHRSGGRLTDDSLELIYKLPPLIRKDLTRKLWNALGPP
jgi:hypothetical protein